VFACRPEWTESFFREIEESRVIAPSDVPLHLAKRFLLLDNAGISKKTVLHWPETSAASASEKTTEINRLNKMLAEVEGDQVAGKAVYVETCGACHRLKGSGGIIGPELTGYDRKNLAYMLLHTVDPNADIREGYETYQIQTVDGRTLVGRIAAQDGGTVSLVPALGGKKTLLTADKIRTQTIQATSTMPERLLSPLSDKEIADLFAYLGAD
jgi:putative heme-binding domain-containing protein